MDLLVKRIEGSITILMQARNLTGYALAMTTAGEAQGVITQISQRLQTCIGGLTGIVEEFRRSIPPTQAEQVPVDTSVFMKFLTTEERADLGQLEHSYSELTIVRDLVGQFRERIFAMGLRRQQAEDRRSEGGR
jgi:hypothetical protein